MSQNQAVLSHSEEVLPREICGIEEHFSWREDLLCPIKALFWADFCLTTPLRGRGVTINPPLSAEAFCRIPIKIQGNRRKGRLDTRNPSRLVGFVRRNGLL